MNSLPFGSFLVLSTLDLSYYNNNGKEFSISNRIVTMTKNFKNVNDDILD